MDTEYHDELVSSFCGITGSPPAIVSLVFPDDNNNNNHKLFCNLSLFLLCSLCILIGSMWGTESVFCLIIYFRFRLSL